MSDDLTRDAQYGQDRERAEVREELSMPSPHDALRHLTLGIDGLRRWFEWFDDVVAPHMSVVVDDTKSPT